MLRSPMVSRMGFALAVIGVAACSADSSTVPPQLDAPAVRYSVEDGLTVLNAQLRAAGTSTTAPSGHIQFKFLPPNPVSPPSPIQVAIEGRIFNPELETLSGEGSIFKLPEIFGEGPLLVGSFDIGLPPNPIRNFRIEATTIISSDVATALSTSRAGYSITIGNLEGRFIPGPPPI